MYSKQNRAIQMGDSGFYKLKEFPRYSEVDNVIDWKEKETHTYPKPDTDMLSGPQDPWKVKQQQNIERAGEGICLLECH